MPTAFTLLRWSCAAKEQPTIHHYPDPERKVDRSVLQNVLWSSKAGHIKRNDSNAVFQEFKFNDNQQDTSTKHAASAECAEHAAWGATGGAKNAEQCVVEAEAEPAEGD